MLAGVEEIWRWRSGGCRLTEVVLRCVKGLECQGREKVRGTIERQ